MVGIVKMPEELEDQGGTGGIQDDGSHGSDFLDDDVVVDAGYIIPSDDDELVFGQDGSGIPQPIINDEFANDIGFKDFERTSGIRYVASGGTPEEIAERQRLLNEAEQAEMNQLIDDGNTKNLALIFLAVGAVAVGG